MHVHTHTPVFPLRFFSSSGAEVCDVHYVDLRVHGAHVCVCMVLMCACTFLMYVCTVPMCACMVLMCAGEERFKCDH